MPAEPRPERHETVAERRLLFQQGRKDDLVRTGDRLASVTPPTPTTPHRSKEPHD